MTPPPYLDTPEAVTRVDTANLHHILREFPDQLQVAEAEFAKVKLPAAWGEVTRVVFCGMGGSAIGSELTSNLPAVLLRKPLWVIRDYTLPAFVGPETLVVVTSYSGDTEEALACFNDSLARHAPCLVVTSGGGLARRASAAGVPLYQFSYEAPPRDSLGYLMAPQVAVLEAAGVLEKGEASLTQAIQTLRQQLTTLVPEVLGNSNLAKHLAYQFLDHVPLIIGTEVTAGVARRWKNQVNEHAKAAGFSEVLPEVDHNTVEGFQFPARFRDDVVVVLLQTEFDHPLVRNRATYLKEFLAEQGVVCETVAAQGPDLWSQKLSLVALGDWVSYYLALLNHIDPSAIPAITQLKRRLRA